MNTRKLLSSITFASLWLGSATFASAQSGVIGGPFDPNSGNYNIVPGGSFEETDNIGVWADLIGLNTSTISRVSSPVVKGARSGLLSSSSDGNYFRYQTGIPLVAGQTYVLSAFVRGEEVGGAVGLDIGNFGGQFFNVTALTNVEKTSSTVGNWYFAYTTFVADNPSMAIRLVNYGTTGANARNYFDDIAVTPVNDFRAVQAVPEPGTMLAIGVGLAALVRRRRGGKIA